MKHKKGNFRNAPNVIPELFKENRFLACVRNVCRANIKFRGLENNEYLSEIMLYKYLYQKNNTKNYDVFLVEDYIRAREIEIWIYKYSEEKNTNKYIYKNMWNFLLSLIKLERNLAQMDKNNSSGIIAERNSDNYEEIVQKLVEVFIYLKQEAIYDENRPL